MCCMRVLLFDNMVSGPPPAVNITASQNFNETLISWAIPDGHPCPIEYNITINGSTVPVASNEQQYTHPIVDECWSTLEISMFATNTVGPGETTAIEFTIVAARK